MSRYRNPAVDKTVTEMEATTDPAKIKAGSDKLIDVWMTDFPVIALNYAPPGWSTATPPRPGGRPTRSRTPWTACSTS